MLPMRLLARDLIGGGSYPPVSLPPQRTATLEDRRTDGPSLQSRAPRAVGIGAGLQSSERSRRGDVCSQLDSDSRLGRLGTDDSEGLNSESRAQLEHAYTGDPPSRIPFSTHEFPILPTVPSINLPHPVL